MIDRINAYLFGERILLKDDMEESVINARRTLLNEISHHVKK